MCSAASRVVQVWVRARDGGGRAGEAPVSVFVLRAGELAPRLRPLPPDLFLREDAPPGALLADLRLDEPRAYPGPLRPRLTPLLSPVAHSLTAFSQKMASGRGCGWRRRAARGTCSRWTRPAGSCWPVRWTARPPPTT